MEEVKSFLDLSSIHGLAYTSSSKSRMVRFFWTLIVITGFSGAGIIIYLSFQEWDENPITTTIKTRPITEITLPKVTVCPPKNTFTNLNYDLMMLENMTMNNETREELTLYAVKLIQDSVFEQLMYNISLIDEDRRYYKWYHGHSDISLPYWCDSTSANNHCYQVGLHYDIVFMANTGTIKTKYFGKKFDAHKTERYIRYTVTFHHPVNEEQKNLNITLSFDIEKNTSPGLETYLSLLNTGESKFTKTFTLPDTKLQGFTLYRNIMEDDLHDMQISQMLGFIIKWYYSGPIVSTFKPSNLYFRRSSSNQICLTFIIHFL